MILTERLINNHTKFKRKGDKDHFNSWSNNLRHKTLWKFKFLLKFYHFKKITKIYLIYKIHIKWSKRRIQEKDNFLGQVLRCIVNRQYREITGTQTLLKSHKRKKQYSNCENYSWSVHKTSFKELNRITLQKRTNLTPIPKQFSNGFSISRED